MADNSALNGDTDRIHDPVPVDAIVGQRLNLIAGTLADASHDHLFAVQQSHDQVPVSGPLPPLNNDEISRENTRFAHRIVAHPQRASARGGQHR